jgi:hypothetical protein
MYILFGAFILLAIGTSKAVRGLHSTRNEERGENTVAGPREADRTGEREKRMMQR